MSFECSIIFRNRITIVFVAKDVFKYENGGVYVQQGSTVGEGGDGWLGRVTLINYWPNYSSFL